MIFAKILILIVGAAYAVNYQKDLNKTDVYLRASPP